MKDRGTIACAGLRSRPARRAVLCLLVALTWTLLVQPDDAVAVPRGSHIRAIEADPLYVRDDTGTIVISIRPYSLTDVSRRDDIGALAGWRDLRLHIAIQSLTGRMVGVSPQAFAVRGCDGLLYRPWGIDLPDGAHPVPTPEAAESIAVSPAERPGSFTIVPLGSAPDDPTAPAALFGDEPLPPFARRSGSLLFRVPATTCLDGVVFTPEPDQHFLLADFSREASVIID